jgi:hypothetical protein
MNKGWLTKALTALLFLTLAMASPARAATYTDWDSWGQWRVVFAGYGSVVTSGSGASEKIRLAPTVATAADRTHAALVVGKTSYKNSRVKMRVTLNEQLRVGSPANTWETGWVVARYTDNEHFYYVALKTNGWELGKRDPAYPGGQRFLATGSNPQTVLGKAQVAVMTLRNNTITVKIDGTTVAKFTDRERPYRSGVAGMYTEDADVTFDRISVTAL